jgi:hypothetical protein
MNCLGTGGQMDIFDELSTSPLRRGKKRVLDSTQQDLSIDKKKPKKKPLGSPYFVFTSF